MFSLRNRRSMAVVKRLKGITLLWDQHPEGSQVHGSRSQCVARYKHGTSSFPGGEPQFMARETSKLTCIVVSRSVSGAGLTSVVICAAADAMSTPTDCMSGCMRGPSDSRVNVDSGEGKVRELELATASICATDDCMILARDFNSAKASCEILRRRVISDT